MRGTWLSPWSFSTADYLGRAVTVSIPFNEATLAINGALTGVRDAGCLYDRVVIGAGLPGQKVFPIPEGAFSVGRVQLANAGFSLITDVANSGFTLGTTEV